MSDTKNLKLPYIIAAQAQKHVTHNEAIRALDALVQLSIKDRDLASPPASPADGDRYIVAAGASGAWTGHENEIAAWQDNAWMFYQQQDGWLAFVVDESTLVAWNGSNWDEISAGGSGGAVNPVPLVGINTTASDPDKLSVKSDTVLFSHDDITPGSGSIQAKMNKATAADTASILFQDDWSGRAEIGLTGDDDFHFKVSDDGAQWHDAIIVDRSSGKARLPQNALNENLMFNLLQDAGRFAGSPEPQGTSGGASHTLPGYISPYNGGAFAQHAKFVHNNSTYGGSGAALDGEIDNLIQILKSNITARRYGPEFWAIKMTTGSGTSGGRTVDGTIRYLLFSNTLVPIWPKSTWGMNIRVLSGSISIDYAPATHSLYKDALEQQASPVITSQDGWVQMVFVGQANPLEFRDYDNALFKTRAAPGSEVLMALPFVLPTQIVPQAGAPIGRLSSLEAWR